MRSGRNEVGQPKQTRENGTRGIENDAVLRACRLSRVVITT